MGRPRPAGATISLDSKFWHPPHSGAGPLISSTPCFSHNDHDPVYMRVKVAHLNIRKGGGKKREEERGSLHSLSPRAMP